MEDKFKFKQGENVDPSVELPATVAGTNIVECRVSDNHINTDVDNTITESKNYRIELSLLCAELNGTGNRIRSVQDILNNVDLNTLTLEEMSTHEELQR